MCIRAVCCTDSDFLQSTHTMSVYLHYFSNITKWFLLGCRRRIITVIRLFTYFFYTLLQPLSFEQDHRIYRLTTIGVYSYYTALNIVYTDTLCCYNHIHIVLVRVVLQYIRNMAMNLPSRHERTIKRHLMIFLNLIFTF